jgi:hypothetical protein
LRHLRAVPYRNDPDRSTDLAVEESIWSDDDLAMGEVRKLGNPPAGMGKSGQTAQYRFRMLPEFPRSDWIVLVYVRDRREELCSRGRRKSQLHLCLRISSASANT